jgi:protein gp37
MDRLIVGGESGNGARPMNPEWVRDIKDQCAVARIAFFFQAVGWGKQKGRWQSSRWQAVAGVSRTEEGSLGSWF